MPDAPTLFLGRAESRLASLGAALGRVETPYEAAWVLCEFTGRELALFDVVVYLLAADGDLVQQAGWGPKRAAGYVLESRIRLRLGQGIVGTSAQRQEPIRIADTRTDTRYVVDDQVNRSELAVPICRDGVLYGVLDSEHPQPDYYHARHEEAMRMLADCTAERLWALVRGR